MKPKIIFSWILRLIVAMILFQTLRFKFTAHPDSVHIFSALGIEPWGRIAVGIMELITVILILLPKTKMVGMVNSLAIISGAIVSHILVLGIDVQNDGGLLFIYAVIIFIATIAYLLLHKEDLLSLIKKFRK
jgi:putative oxidoreductase